MSSNTNQIQNLKADVSAVPIPAPATTAEIKEKKPRKPKTKKTDATATTEGTATTETKPKVKRSRKPKDASATGAENANANANTEPKEKKTRKRKERDTTTTTEGGATGEIKKEKKKRARKNKEGESTATTVSEQETTTKPAEKKKKRKSKVNPSIKKPLSAFLMFSQKYRPQLKDLHPEASFGDKSKLTGQKWREASEQERLVYEEKAEADRKRYKDEVDAMLKPPKRPNNPFMIFSRKRRPLVVATLDPTQQDQQDRMKKMGFIQKQLAQEWKALSKEEKAVYELLAQEDRVRYDTQKKEYDVALKLEEERKLAAAVTPAIVVK